MEKDVQDVLEMDEENWKAQKGQEMQEKEEKVQKSKWSIQRQWWLAEIGEKSKVDQGDASKVEQLFGSDCAQDFVHSVHSGHWRLSGLYLWYKL